MSDNYSIEPRNVQLPLYESLGHGPCASGFPKDKAHFVGGNDDELISIPAFVGLECKTGKTLPFYVKLGIAKAFKRTQNLKMAEALERVEAFLRRAAEDKREKEPRRDTEELKAADWLDPLIDGLYRREQIKPRKVVVQKDREVWHFAKRAGPPPATDLIRTSMRALAPYQVYVQAGQFIAKQLQLPYLGIFYADHLRIRPVGQVLGRLLYTIGLAPGEETTLQQKSWTKRESMLEQIHDREAETSLEYNSTWSTSYTTQFAEEWSKSLKSSLTSKVGGTYEGITAEVGSSLAADQGYKQTASRQSTFNRELSRKVAARAKQQHKTTFKVTSEVGEEFATKRVLRNVNIDRSLQLHFYKTLQQHHVTLERHDAQLCLRLCIPDPVRSLREMVIAELAKLDPVIAPESGPQLGSGSWSKTLEATQYAGGGWEIGNETNSAKLTVDIPPNHSLSMLKGPDFLRARNEDGQTVYDGDFGAFTDDGGRLGFTLVPTIGAEGRVEMEVSVTYPEPSWWVNGSDVSEVSYTIEIGATLSQQFTEEFRQRREEWEEAERERIRKTFSRERLVALVSEPRLSEALKAAVISRVFLAAEFAAGTEPDCLTVSQLEGCVQWDLMYKEFLPWWLTPRGHEYRASLDTPIHKLPAEVIQALDLWEFLAAPYAIVYLPLKPGCEEKALMQLLRDSSYEGLIKECVDKFRAFHKETFPPVERALSDPDDIHSPVVQLGTPLGNDDWDHAWEQRTHSFVVLDEWSETLPTDGVHVEPILGSCVGTSPLKHVESLVDLRQREATAAKDEGEALSGLAEWALDGDDPPA